MVENFQDSIVFNDGVSTPEKSLWIAVLLGMITELKKTTSLKRLDVVCAQSNSEWTKLICEWINVDHKRFHDGILYLAKQRSCFIHGNLGEK